MPEYLKVTVTAESPGGKTHTWTIHRCANFEIDTTYYPPDVASAWLNALNAPRIKTMSFSVDPLPVDDNGELYRLTITGPDDDPGTAYERAVKDAAESAREHALRVDEALLRLTEARRAAGGQA